MERRRTGWHPPHCPNPNCKYHNGHRASWRWKRKGFYTRETSPQRVPRFTCLHCNRQFSCQTFSTTYWQKKPELISAIFSMMVGCMANRQIARALRCSHSTVAHQIARLGRHCLLYQARELVKFQSMGPIAIDGFESFEWSQYYPFHHNVAVCVQTGYFLFHTDSPLRRKGRMTSHQKRRRVELELLHGRPDPMAVEVGMRELLETIVGDGCTTIRSDDHRAYPRSMRGLTIEHQITSSKERRDKMNPLWEVNLLDLMIRHSTSAHKRETIAWPKRRQASAEKLAIFQVWRNYVKRRWEKGAPVSSAMLAGLSGRLLRTRDVLSRRLFRTRMSLPPRWSLYYDREVKTRPLSVNRRHVVTYAY